MDAALLCQPSSLTVNSQLTNHPWGDHPSFNVVKTTRAVLEARLCPLQGAQETLKSDRRKLFWVQPGRQICRFRFAPLCFLELLSRFHLDLHSSAAADTYVCVGLTAFSHFQGGTRGFGHGNGQNVLRAHVGIRRWRRIIK